MCEMLGVSSKERMRVDPYLNALVPHSAMHPHGWGIAVFYGNAVSLEKEPKTALASDYLASRLKHPVEAQNMIAHIRLATRGSMVYENCHPFIERDSADRAWTLAHNGTIFSSALLDRYKGVQQGSTDSERILCRLIHRMAELNGKTEGKPDAKQRFDTVDALVLESAPRNKLNLLIFDGELLYVHTNMRDTLYVKKTDGAAVFATVPLDGGVWENVPMMCLQAYKDGELVYTGTQHSFEYRKPDPEPDALGWAGL